MKWQYKMVCAKDDCQEQVNQLNKQGEEGWELVSVTPADDVHHRLMYFKKPKL